MQKYPLYLANQLNEPLNVKTRIRMIFRKNSPQIKTLKYLSIFVIALFSLGIVACQKQPVNLAPVSTLLNEEHKTDVSKIGQVNAMAFHKPGEARYFEVKEPQDVDFMQVEQDKAKRVNFQLFNAQSQLLASNETEVSPAKGFSYKFNKTGTYYIKINDLGKQEKLLIAAVFLKNKKVK